MAGRARPGERAQGVAFLSLVAFLTTACRPTSDAPTASPPPAAATVGTPGKFAAPARAQPDPGNPDLWRISVVSKAPASWNEAEDAITAAFAHRCPEGARSFPQTNVPPVPFGGGGGAWKRTHPAGTEFVENYRCAGPLPGEQFFGEEVSREEAMDRIAAIVAEQPVPEGVGSTASAFMYPEPEGKYPALTRHLGRRLSNAQHACGSDLVQVHPPVLGSWPDGEPRGERKMRMVVVGTWFACARRPIGTSGHADVP